MSGPCVHTPLMNHVVSPTGGYVCVNSAGLVEPDIYIYIHTDVYICWRQCMMASMFTPNRALLMRMQWMHQLMKEERRGERQAARS